MPDIRLFARSGVLTVSACKHLLLLERAEKRLLNYPDVSSAILLAMTGLVAG